MVGANPVRGNIHRLNLSLASSRHMKSVAYRIDREEYLAVLLIDVSAIFHMVEHSRTSRF